MRRSQAPRRFQRLECRRNAVRFRFTQTIAKYRLTDSIVLSLRLNRWLTRRLRRSFSQTPIGPSCVFTASANRPAEGPGRTGNPPCCALPASDRGPVLPRRSSDPCQELRSPFWSNSPLTLSELPHRWSKSSTVISGRRSSISERRRSGLRVCRPRRKVPQGRLWKSSVPQRAGKIDAQASRTPHVGRANIRIQEKCHTSPRSGDWGRRSSFRS